MMLMMVNSHTDGGDNSDDISDGNEKDNINL